MLKLTLLQVGLFSFFVFNENVFGLPIMQVIKSLFITIDVTLVDKFGLRLLINVFKSKLLFFWKSSINNL